ncbi:MAG: hypothetical protein JXD22_17325 [Sedimentisphaerales bacterium]|nr:hypothetical protein [Sedimentisphaerales bacterium]
MKNSKLRLLIFFVAILVLLSPVAVFIHKQVLNERLSKRLLSISESGGFITIDDLDLSYNIPDNCENAADIYLKAFSSYDSWDCDEKSEYFSKLPLFGQFDYFENRKCFDKDTKILVKKFLADNQLSLSLLHKAKSFKNCRYPISYKNTVTGNLQPHHAYLGDIKFGVKLLVLDAIYQAESNSPENAFSSIEASLKLSNTITDFATSIKILIKSNLDQFVICELEKIFPRICNDKNKLAELITCFSETYDSYKLKDLILREQCLAINKASDVDEICDEFPPFSSFLKFSYKYTGLYEKNILAYLDCTGNQLQALGSDDPVMALWKCENNIVNLTSSYLLLQRMSGVLCRNCVKALDTQTMLSAAIIAIAYKQYYLENGRYPDDIEDLASANVQPKYIDFAKTHKINVYLIDDGYVVSIQDDSFASETDSQPIMDSDADLNNIIFSVISTNQ